MASFFYLAANFVSILGQAMTIAIFVRVLLSWFPIGGDNPVTEFVVRVTDPILVPLRRVIPPLGMFDLSPMVALMLLGWGTPVVAGLIRQLG